MRQHVCHAGVLFFRGTLDNEALTIQQGFKSDNRKKNRDSASSTGFPFILEKGVVKKRYSFAEFLLALHNAFRYMTISKETIQLVISLQNT